MPRLSGVKAALAATLAMFVAARTMGAAAQGAAPVPLVPAPSVCLPPGDISDPSGAVTRNAAALAAADICNVSHTFTQDTLQWNLLVVRNRQRSGSVFWVVPHDDEGAAFDSAVASVREYGGTVVAVKTGGQRENAGRDPNRNFDRGSGRLCPSQPSHSTVFAREVLRWREGQAPIVALHTNDPGFTGDKRSGMGTISIRLSSQRLKPFRAARAIGRSPDDTMVYVTSQQPPEQNPELMGFVSRLNARRVNVLYEIVNAGSNDCSLSNYAVLENLGRYFNVEAINGDMEAQRQIIRILMNEIGVEPL